jgi:hypothetical protein
MGGISKAAEAKTAAEAAAVAKVKEDACVAMHARISLRPHTIVA